MAKSKPTTVTEYIQAAPTHAQKKLREIRAILKKVAPDATEKLKSCSFTGTIPMRPELSYSHGK